MEALEQAENYSITGVNSRDPKDVQTAAERN